MRTSFLAALPLIGILALSPAQSSAQVSVSVRLGPPIVVTQYAPEAYGDWHTSYRSWTPVTRYYYDGHWYAKQVRGSHAVVVYRSRDGHYFLPPQDREWRGRDKRYNYKRAPLEEYYQHVDPAPPRRRP
jgi:hypothetical protein